MTSPLNTDPDKEFCVAVQRCIDKYSTRELAEEFEVAPSTVTRWANGVAKPHPKVKALILVYIASLNLPEEDI